MTFKKLTEYEQLVMKTVWDAAEELSLTEIMQRVNGKYHKDWKPQTVSTFLTRLVNKEYLSLYRQGRVFFYRILVPQAEYKAQLTNDYVEFWYHGNADELIVSLTKGRTLRPDEIEKIKALIHR